MTINEFIFSSAVALGAIALGCHVYVVIICRKELAETLKLARKITKDHPDEMSIFGAPEGWGTGKVIDIKARAGK